MAEEETTTIASEVLSASLGGAISASILYPLEVLKTKMQAADGNDDNDDHGDKDDDKDKKAPPPAGMVQTAVKLYQRQGASVFVRGIETSAFQSAIEKALYFFAYTALKKGYFKLHNNNNSNDSSIGAFANLMLGCAAEWMHLPISLPIDAWTTQIKISTTHATPMQILLSMLSSPNKASSWYKGLSAYYVLCFKPALQYTVYEQVKTFIVSKRREKTLSAAEAFLLGMVARTVATVLVFPCVRAKVLLQKQAIMDQQAQTAADSTTADSTTTTSSSSTTTTTSSTRKKQDLTMAKVLWRTLQRQGLAGWYQGLGPELTRGIFSAALMLMIKERVAGTVRKVLVSKP